ncbi:hypothetical protein [Paenibacillus xylanexedens]|uniref:hypothetical protein n=1 Tax=Paenibacillus xylanexedens TaxID=528191 RepID=UPI0011A2CE40|nr:hypothetical protein [Paenibacillus xylanexedens]
MAKTKYSMSREYQGDSNLKTESLLEALHIAANYEASLYANGRLIMSCLGWPREMNYWSLRRQGITYYVNMLKGQWTYRYTDPSKNEKAYHVRVSPYSWGNEPQLVAVIDSRKDEYGGSETFKTLQEAFKYVREQQEQSGIKKIECSVWDESITQITVDPIDWRDDRKVELHALYKDGVIVETGFNVGIWEALNRKLKYEPEHQWSIAEYTPPAQEEFSPGEVVWATLKEGEEHNEKSSLFLIESVTFDGKNKQYNIRDIDYFNADKHTVLESQLRIPELQTTQEGAM